MRWTAIHAEPGKLYKAPNSEITGATAFGDYRILCDIQDNKLVVLVIEIGHRKEVYR